MLVSLKTHHAFLRPNMNFLMSFVIWMTTKTNRWPSCPQRVWHHHHGQNFFHQRFMIFLRATLNHRQSCYQLLTAQYQGAIPSKIARCLVTTINFTWHVRSFLTWSNQLRWWMIKVCSIWLNITKAGNVLCMKSLIPWLKSDLGVNFTSPWMQGSTLS